MEKVDTKRVLWSLYSSGFYNESYYTNLKQFIIRVLWNIKLPIRRTQLIMKLFHFFSKFDKIFRKPYRSPVIWIWKKLPNLPDSTLLQRLCNMWITKHIQILYSCPNVERIIQYGNYMHEWLSLSCDQISVQTRHWEINSFLCNFMLFPHFFHSFLGFGLYYRSFRFDLKAESFTSIVLHN